MYADDLAIWLMTIANNSSEKCPIYNVGSDEAINIIDLARLIGETYKVSVSPPLLISDRVDRYIPSITKEKKDLNLTLKFKLSQAIKETIKKIRHQKNG